VVVDTGIVIRHLRTATGKTATTLSLILGAAPCFVTYITVYELFFGATDQAKRRDVHDALLPLEIIGGSARVARRAGLLRRHFVQHGWDVGAMDPLVAATCLEAALPILTTNVDHFLRVPGLLVLSPDQIASDVDLAQLIADARRWNADYRRRHGYDAIPRI